MNLKERGITVGDLLIFGILIISTILIFNKVKDTNQKSHLDTTYKDISISIFT